MKFCRMMHWGKGKVLRPVWGICGAPRRSRGAACAPQAQKSGRRPLFRARGGRRRRPASRSGALGCAAVLRAAQRRFVASREAWLAAQPRKIKKIKKKTGAAGVPHRSVVPRAAQRRPAAQPRKKKQTKNKIAQGDVSIFSQLTIFFFTENTCLIDKILSNSSSTGPN